MSPEAKARLAIDERIQQAGWLLQDARQINLQQEVVEHLEETPWMNWMG